MSELKTQSESETTEKDTSCQQQYKDSGEMLTKYSDKINFKAKTKIEQKEIHYIMIKGSIKKRIL